MKARSGYGSPAPQRRRLLAVFLLFSAGIIGGGYVYYLRYSAAAVQEKSDLITVIGESKAQDISDWRAERKAHLVSMAQSPVMRIYLRRLLAAPHDNRLLGLVKERLDSFVLYSGFNSAYFTGPDGRVLVWGGEKEAALNPQAAELLRRAADPRAAVMSDLVPDRNGKPAIYLAVLAAESGAGKLYLTVKLDPFLYLYPLIRKWPTSSPSAETLLVRRDGNDVLFLNELRHRAGTALKFRRPIAEKDLPAAAAVAGFTGVMRGRDYRGVPVLAYAAPVEGSPWFVVSKIDLSEAFGQLHRSAELLLALVLALLIAGGAVTYSIMMRREAEYASTLTAAEARFTRLYQQMLDSYVYTDMKGRVVECNAAFERLTGYALGELKKLNYVDFTPEKWHAAEKRIVEEKIIGQGASGVYEKEYLRKDGSAVPVELLTVLDRDREGRPAGMWTIIRDLTGRRKAEKALAESEEQFRLMFEEHSAVMLLVDPLSGAIVRANRAASDFYGYPPERLRAMTTHDINILPEEESARIEGRITRGDENFFVLRHRLASGEPRTVEVRSSSISVGGRKLNFEIITDITERELAVERLRDRERALKEEQKVAKVGSWNWDIPGDVISWSEEYYRIYGADPSRKPPGYQEHLKAYTPESAARLDAAVKRNVETGEPYELDLELADPKASARWVTARSETKRDETGRIVGLRGTAQDITERKLAEQERSILAGRLRLAADSAGLGVWDWDVKANVLVWDERLYELYGIRDRSVFHGVFEAWVAALHPEDRDRAANAIAAAIAGGAEYHDEFRILRPDGRERILKSDALVLRGADGKPERMIGVNQDITERKRAELRLRESEQALKEAQHMAQLGSWSFDPATGTGTWSDEVALIHDLPAGSPITPERGITYYAPESRPLIEKAVKEAVEQGRPYDLELEIISEKGARKWVRTVGQAVVKEGRTLRVHGTLQDITRIKQAELELKRYSAELGAKNKELEDFLYVASHDLRGPMVNIQGFSQNLQKYCAEISSEVRKNCPGTAAGLLDRRVPEAIGFLLTSAARMDSLINALLKVSRIGRGELRKDRVDMNGLVKAILASINYQLREAGAEAEAGELPPCLGDKDQLSQVFGNLLDNAVKYRSPERTLRVRITGGNLDDGAAEYRVADNGVGLTEEEAAGKLWTLFYRSDPKGPVSGDGIGLTAAKRIVEKHGGTISAERNAAGGATIVVRLPGWRDT